MGVMSFVYGMSSTLGRLANSFQKALDLYTTSNGEQGVNPSYKGILPILRLIDNAIIPVLIVLIAVGTIYSVVLGVNMARADSSEKREEAKKRLINFLIGIVIIIVLIAIMYVLADQLPNILSGINDASVTDTTQPS